MNKVKNYDVLIKGGKIITMDKDRRIIENGAIATEKNKLSKIFRADELPENISATKTINANRKVIIPGLIKSPPTAFCCRTRSWSVCSSWTAKAFPRASTPRAC